MMNSPAAPTGMWLANRKDWRSPAPDPVIDCRSDRFDEAQWRHDVGTLEGQVEYVDDLTRSQRMARVAIKCLILEGRERADIRKSFGSPPAASYEGGEWIYPLGDFPKQPGAEDLMFFFDERGNVTSVAIVRGRSD